LLLSGLIVNPKVPSSKQVNWYQYGFLSVKTALGQELGIDFTPQIGTFVW